MSLPSELKHTMKARIVIITAAAMIASVISATAAIIPIVGVTATTTMGSGFGTSLANTLNGAGLSFYDPSATHSGTSPGNSWVSSPGVLTGSITYDLGGLQALNGFSFWNQNGGGPGSAGAAGIQGVLISYSANGVTYNPLPGAPTVFAQVAPVTAPAVQFSFAEVNAAFIRFDIASNYGFASNVGYGEVMFTEAAAVPEPSTYLAGALLLLPFAASTVRRFGKNRPV